MTRVSNPAYFSADFETTTNPIETEVWLSGYVNIETPTEKACRWQTNIKDFFKELYNDCENLLDVKDTFIVFFHNLKFDGSFILNFFDKIGLEYETFINDMGQWYNIEVNFGRFKIHFKDSLKIMNFSIKQMAKAFNLEMAKGVTPLLFHPPKKILPEWIDYLFKDILINAQALAGLFLKEGYKKFTSAGQALYEFKALFKKEEYEEFFPRLPHDQDWEIRKAYRGGWTYLKEGEEGKLQSDMVVYDINSMYAGVQLKHRYPVGKPEIYDKFVTPKDDELAFYKIAICFELKTGFLPCIQIKDKETLLLLNKRGNDYLHSSNGEYLPMTVTQVELELFKKHYDINFITFKTFVFKSKYHLFDEYIYKFKDMKENAPNIVTRNKAKSMLVSLYGKFGSKTETKQKIPYIENGILKFKDGETEEVDPVYIPIACYITAYARHFIISSAQSNYDRFVYADTDSLHLKGREAPALEIHPSEFGKWAHEATAKRAKFLRQKLYMEELEQDGVIHLDVKGAGMTDEVKQQVTFDNFAIGLTLKGKRASKQIKGGVHIYETEFSIREHHSIF